MKAWLSVLAGVAACGSSRLAPDGATDDAAVDAVVIPPNYDSWAQICAKHRGDLVTERFCAGTLPPTLGSLADLEQLLDMRTTNTAFNLTGMSTGVGIRMVTPMNPRAILMQDDHLPDQRYELLSFARGEPLVELIADDPAANTLRFFALRFVPECETTPAGCSTGDLLTWTIEVSWKGYVLYDEDALANTPLDCNTCHQPNGPGTPKILRMQERLSPWTHWFTGGGWNVFQQSHDGEYAYAGFPVSEVPITTPDALEEFVTARGFSPQPNEFVSQVIHDELASSGTSATWQALYNNAVTGQAIPPPYFVDDQTDPGSEQAMFNTYRGVVAGTLPRDALPDPASIVTDAALIGMSIRPKPGLDGRGILVHMCSQCHNSRLDQTLTRARFNVMTLDTMSRQEKDLAITRLQLPDNNPQKMPPPRFHVLSDKERARAITELSN